MAIPPMVLSKSGAGLRSSPATSWVPGIHIYTSCPTKVRRAGKEGRASGPTPRSLTAASDPTDPPWRRSAQQSGIFWGAPGGGWAVGRGIEIRPGQASGKGGTRSGPTPAQLTPPSGAQRPAAGGRGVRGTPRIRFSRSAWRAPCPNGAGGAQLGNQTRRATSEREECKGRARRSTFYVGPNVVSRYDCNARLARIDPNLLFPVNLWMTGTYCDRTFRFR